MPTRFDPRERPLGPAARVAQWFSGSIVKSIQSGTISTTAVAATATLSPAVNVLNTLLIYNGMSQNDANETATEALITLTLTNTTTITATRIANLNGGTRKVSWTALEFQPGIIKSIQYGTVVIAAAASGTATITAVNYAKSILIPLGTQSTVVGALSGQTAPWIRTELTNATTVTSTMETATTVTTSFVVVEFF